GALLCLLCHTNQPLKRLIVWNKLLDSHLKAELERLHEASFGWALNCCLRKHAQAEEVLQTVYLKILQGQACYRGESSFRTWLFAVIRNTAISERRKYVLRKLTSLAGGQTEIAENDQPDVELERSEMQQRFQQALLRLP